MNLKSNDFEWNLARRLFAFKDENVVWEIAGELWAKRREVGVISTKITQNPLRN